VPEEYKTEIVGVKTIAEAFERIRVAAMRELVDAVTITAKKTVVDAKNLAPVGTPETTGIPDYEISYSYMRSIRDTPLETRLDRKAIRKGVTAGGKIINPNTGRPVDYAVPLEFGRSKQAPRGVLYPSAFGNTAYFVVAAKKAVVRGILSA